MHHKDHNEFEDQNVLDSNHGNHNDHHVFFTNTTKQRPQRFFFISSFQTFQIYGISQFAKLLLHEWSSDDGREGVDLPALVLGLGKVFSDLSF